MMPPCSSRSQPRVSIDSGSDDAGRAAVFPLSPVPRPLYPSSPAGARRPAPPHTLPQTRAAAVRNAHYGALQRGPGKRTPTTNASQLTSGTPPSEERLNVTQLFQQHYDGLYRYLVRLTGDSDLAADAAQEAFVRLVERPPQDRHVRAWLFAVATNVVRDNARARARWVTLLMGSPDRAPMGDVAPGPDAAAESAERRKLVRAALDRLSWKERTVLLMREEGFAHHEIADAVGTTTGSVGTMIARALNKLAGELAPTSESLR
jgi:RNA polymerase sigma-70 factor (ECF subfamily)